MGVYWSRGGPAAISAQLRDVIKAVDPDAVEAIMRDEMSKIQVEEVKLARQYTENAGTATSGKRGRIETGTMRDAIQGEVRTGGKGQVYSRVGFLRGQQEYFKWQTSTGFTKGGYRPDKYIAPTFALRDAHEDVIPMLRQAGTNTLRRLLARMRKA